nr:SDR family oxidoreductase [uncultured Friedmanniella sp.]
MDLGLSGRAFVVTAASSGLGRASAAALVAEGARVAVVARRAEVLAELVDALNRTAPERPDGGPAAVSLAADVADPGTGQRACASALEAFGRLDGALVSVGGPAAGSVRGTTAEQWRTAFDGVFLSALGVTESVLQAGTASDLAVAWVLSTSVKSPVGGLAASNGLRPGLGMLVKQLADEVGPDGTRVVGLMPGRIDTERVQHLDNLAADPAEARKSAEASIPLRRYGRPDEFGRVAAFVLSPAASYLTGCVLPVEGGALRSL